MAGVKDAAIDGAAKSIGGKVGLIGFGVFMFIAFLVMLFIFWPQLSVILGAANQLDDNSEAIATLDTAVEPIEDMQREIAAQGEQIDSLMAKIAEQETLLDIQGDEIAELDRQAETLETFRIQTVATKEEDAAQRFAINGALSQFKSFEERFEVKDDRLTVLEKITDQHSDGITDISDNLGRTDVSLIDVEEWINNQRQRAIEREQNQKERDNQILQSAKWQSEMAKILQQVRDVVVSLGNEIDVLNFPPYQNDF